ncbi:MAG TPA: enoyl-CoA hydratase-related protein [Actinocrinis sp.]|nr:enoyl-CoA hydratase-related protein [Actinocrinis sp.]HXR71872.1 enoyl-CoA hydratase-related protein [Actinocrinis sp.]
MTEPNEGATSGDKDNALGAQVLWRAEYVRIEIAPDTPRVATIRIDRPKLNPLDSHVQAELRQAAQQVTANPDLRAVVLYGGPIAFAAGADIKEMAALSYTDMVQRSGTLQDSFTAIARIPKPVIAAVTGFALGGGCELALCADLRVAAADARFGQPEIKLGLIPGAGGTQRLSRLIGPARAKDLVFTGRMVDAEEALRIGLADRVVAPEEVYPTALAWAAELAAGPAFALRAAKDAIDRGLETDLATGLEIERAQFAALFATPDRSTGMQSFIEHGPGKAVFD